MSKSTHENEFVTDTIGLVLRLEGRKLGAKAKGIFESVESGQAVLYVPGVVFLRFFTSLKNNGLQFHWGKLPIT